MPPAGRSVQLLALNSAAAGDKPSEATAGAAPHQGKASISGGTVGGVGASCLKALLFPVTPAKN